jgi:hypothetical protein
MNITVSAPEHLSAFQSCVYHEFGVCMRLVDIDSCKVDRPLYGAS